MEFFVPDTTPQPRSVIIMTDTPKKLAMVMATTVQSFALIQIHNAILFINI